MPVSRTLRPMSSVNGGASSDNMPPEVEIVEHIREASVVDLSTELLEIPVDRLFDSAQEIPILRTLAGLARMGIGVREYLFARKLLKFYSQMGRATLEQRATFVNRLREDGELARVGETILEVLDKALTAEKAELVGRVYAHCIAEGIAWRDCERMCEMTTAAYLDDLRYFYRTDPSMIGETGDEVEHLLALGFYVREGKRFGDTVMLGVQPELTTYGKHLHAAFGAHS